MLAVLGLALAAAGVLPGLWNADVPSRRESGADAEGLPGTQLEVASDARVGDGAKEHIGLELGNGASSVRDAPALAAAPPTLASPIVAGQQAPTSGPQPAAILDAPVSDPPPPSEAPLSAADGSSAPEPGAEPIGRGRNAPGIVAEPSLADRPAAEAADRWLEVTVKRGDNLTAIFKRSGLEQRDLYAFLHAGKEARALERLRPGQKLRFRVDAQDRLRGLVYWSSLTESLHIVRDDGEDGKLRIESRTRPLDTEVRFADAHIESSLFGAGQAAGLSDAVIMRIAEIFAWDIDFALDIRSGDRFSVLYEEEYLNGEKLRDGEVLAVEFENQGKTYRAVRYTNADGESGYYTPAGRSLRKAFLRTPVKFSRISSRFTTGRYHPVLHRIRAHKGVDYAAPRGTPVRATGNGKVAFKGRKGGYGRVIVLQHGSRYTTVYAHLSRYAHKLRKGQPVEQGQVIGYVGSSGLATGPHLHYEFRIDNRHVDPLKVKFPAAEPIPKWERQAFAARVGALQTRMNRERTTVVAVNQAQ